MRNRALLLGLLAAAGMLTLAVAATPRQFEELWRRGEFATLAQLLAGYSAEEAQSVAELDAAAAAAFECQDYVKAATLYAALAQAYESDVNEYIAARSMQLRCLWNQSGQNKSADWIRTARNEIDNTLATAGSSAKQRQIALELDYFIADLTGQPSEHEDELFRTFPSAESTLKDAKARIDDISIEADDEKRRILVQRFLESYPQTAWRHTAYRYLLHTEYRLADHSALDKAAAQYLAEYPDNPESLGAVSRYYFEADYNLETGLHYAQRSVELYETVLGLDGSQASLGRVNSRTATLKRMPDYQPPGERAQFLNYLGSRYNLARFHLLNDHAEAALALVLPVIALDPYTSDEQETLAPFYLVAGQAHTKLGQPEKAYASFTGAMVEGDSRQRYSWLAAAEREKVAKSVAVEEENAARAEFLPEWIGKAGLPEFEDVTEQAGLRNMARRRIAWGDVQGDGYPDLLLDGGVLLINNRAGQFVEQTKESGLPGALSGGLFADIDNDGDLDIYAFAGASGDDLLLRNDDGHFSDITSVAGKPSDEYATEAASWLDANADGWIDLYVVNYEQSSDDTMGELGVGTPDYFYVNTGKGVFRRQPPAENGMNTPFGQLYAGRGANAGDFNNDGLTDLFVGNYRLQENFLWVGAGGGKFENRARFFNVAGWSEDQWWGHTIGSDWGDIDNDGDLDLISANLAHPRYEYFSDKSQLLINAGASGDYAFSDERARRGIKFEETHADPALFDANNDGSLDLYITSTYPNRRSFLYVNDGTGGFTDTTFLSNARVFDGWGCAWADYDFDGDLDLAVGSPSGMRLLRNNGTANNWLQVVCVGAAGEPPARVTADGPIATQTFSNTAAIGTRVTLTTGALTQMREIQSGKGTGSGNELLAHFGLGSYRGSCSLMVRFPSGSVVTAEVSAVNQRVLINERDAIPASEPAEAQPPPDEDVPFSRDTSSR